MRTKDQLENSNFPELVLGIFQEDEISMIAKNVVEKNIDISLALAALVDISSIQTLHGYIRVDGIIEIFCHEIELEDNIVLVYFHSRLVTQIPISKINSVQVSATQFVITLD